MSSTLPKLLNYIEKKEKKKKEKKRKEKNHILSQQAHNINERCVPAGYKYIVLNLNLNGLLVIRQIDNISPGGAPGGKLVPGSHKRCELGHTVIRHFSTGDQRIREVIPVPDSLWKEITFVRLFAS